MTTLLGNPFSWHSSSAGINAPIASLSFNSPNDTKIPVFDLEKGKEIEMFIMQHSMVSKVSWHLYMKFQNALLFGQSL